MDLAPYLETLRRDLAATAAPGGPDVARAAELLTSALDASMRLSLLEVLSHAADEITAKLSTSAVEVRLRGGQADFVVTPIDVPAPPPMTPQEPSGDVTRITLRLPESLKDTVERAAAAEGVSVNTWLVRAVQIAAQGGPPTPPVRGTAGRRITGFGRA
ncbi:toxin-antitoxin system HicB family antitoxin [Phytohabitans sp. ZYX-F-186]|uniref:Toxin-antitoxin system HicB family antitoxin n=1 Tax=Phytohabitans maris TaxID=3071409 RepID=A0ABU0ZJW4_9ACTN|nr:toxin-antitoxin system HicB family antitoxin [Phytohabitans sp. ZYX-F-186]MDQ7907350.1 toxin-antitoxin system HicB family antitoxin [Phytohabitans sp. ZYX-F-186]